MRISHPNRLRISLVSLSSILLACNTLNEASSSEPPVATLQPDIEYGSGQFNLPNPSAGLSELSSYVSTLKLNFDGTRDGVAEQWSKTYSLLATNVPSARALTIDIKGSAPDTRPVFMAQRDGMHYEKFGDETCAATP